jgi:hypothetical protein
MSQIELRGFDNFSRFDAPGANFHAAISASWKLDANGLQVRVKSPSRFVVSV